MLNPVLFPASFGTAEPPFSRILTAFLFPGEAFLGWIGDRFQKILAAGTLVFLAVFWEEVSLWEGEAPQGKRVTGIRPDR